MTVVRVSGSVEGGSVPVVVPVVEVGGVIVVVPIVPAVKVPDRSEFV
jgi:hypothetical protein